MKQSKYSMFAVVMSTLLFLVTACNKEYGYEFEDGYTHADFPDTIEVELDTSMYKVDRSKFTQARVFPGLVGIEEPRLENHTVSLDLDYVDVESSDLRISVAPEAYLSTGLYAPAGELIVIKVPENIYGLQIQLGAHTDNLTGKPTLKRDPLIYTRKQLFPGVNYIRNLYGGTIWVLPAKSLGKTVHLTFSGAVKSPDFVLGETTDEEWLEMISKTTVPWFELRGKRIIFTLPTARLKRFPLNNPTELMEAWDGVIEKDYWEWTGMSLTTTDVKHKAPDLQWRVVHDIQPSVGAQHSGYPVVAMANDNYFKQAITLDAVIGGSNWGTYHELGHNMQQGAVWSWEDLGEVSNNLFSFKVAHRYGIVHGNAILAWNKAKDFVGDADADKEFSELDVTGRMAIFLQVFEKYGYDFMTYLYTSARNARFESSNNQDKIDFFYERLSEFVEKDMEAYMNAWGLYISSVSKDKIAGQFPSLDRNTWMFDPIEHTGGADKIVVELDRSDWVSSGDYDEPSGRSTANALDGDPSTVWHMSKQHGYPHTFNVDMGTTNQIGGFMFVQRSLSDGLKLVEIQVSTDNSTWKSLGEFTVAQEEGKLYVELNQSETARYFKIICKSDYKGNNFTAVAEIGAIY